MWRHLVWLSAAAFVACQPADQYPASFGWRWQLAGSPPGAAGEYYVRLPESEHRVVYSAGAGVYHGATSLTSARDHSRHSSSFALGQTAIDLARGQGIHPALQQTTSLLSNTSVESILPQNINEALSPIEIYLLQQQYGIAAANQDQLVQILPNVGIQYVPPYQDAIQLMPHSIHGPAIHYQNVNAEESNKHQQEENTSSDTLSGKETIEQKGHDFTDKVEVFKDHNCTEESETFPETDDGFKKTTKLFADSDEKFDLSNVNGKFGIKLGDGPVRLETQYTAEKLADRDNSRSDRHYWRETSTAASTPSVRISHASPGISKLVASTQDLISNEDLLKINHSVEKYGRLHNDDIIKPQPKQKYKTDYIHTSEALPANTITVKSKLQNILNTEIVNVENNDETEQVLSPPNQYKFTSPIVVEDTTAHELKEQVIDHIVSTVAPYLDKGYEVSSVSNIVQNNFNNYASESSYGDLINVTPRPLGPKYLAPITVALRLQNTNDSQLYNSLEDHLASDSELVEEKIKPREKTVVEIQQSIPVDITHYNQVEMHTEYLEDGRSNKDTTIGNMAKTLYNKVVESLGSNDHTGNKNDGNKYGMADEYKSINNDGQEFNYSHEHLESSENMQSESVVQPYQGNIHRKGFLDFFITKKTPKYIQPIVIEKEVPVTKYVDRIVEKPVPYPEHVVKEVDKPIVLPVPYDKYIDRPVQITKYIDRPYAVGIPQPYPVEVKVPYPVEQRVFVDRPNYVPYPIEKIVEKQIPYPVPTPVVVPYEQRVLYPVPIEKRIPVDRPVPVETIVEKPVPVPYPVEKRVPYPVAVETKVPYPVEVEKRVPVPYPVETVVEKRIPVPQIVEKQVQVEVPKPYPVPVKYPQPYPVDRIVEKKVPYPVPVDRIVEKKVPYEVQVPVEKIVEKIVEKPYYVTKYVDKPYPVETKVPYAVEKIVEKKVPYPVPYEVKVPYPVEKIVERPVHIPFKVPYAVDKLVPFYSSQNYHRFSPEYHRLGMPPPQLQNPDSIPPYYQKALQNQEEKAKRQVWSNLYASSYQYLNNSTRNDFRRSPLLSKYLEYLTNVRDRHQSPTRETKWKNENMVVELKLRRGDRTPKANNLNIEYGFRPPMVPSIEVDLDGIPVHGQNS